VNELELKLKEYLKVDHLLYVTNGTIAIQILLKALGLNKKIITTPFTYIATSSSIVWENCTPVFADIDQETLNINPSEVRKLIDDETSGVLATHVFGNPCDVDGLDSISKEFNIPILYDAAHAFGVQLDGKSLFRYGTASTTSFHATKLFHTVEGGAIFPNSKDLTALCAQYRNFGHITPYQFSGIGINGKNSELHAAMGLCVLSDFESIMSKRKTLCETYDKWLLKGKIRKPLIKAHNVAYNYSYYPVLFEEEEILLRVVDLLNQNNILPRRYFYPSLSTIDYLGSNHNTPIADDVAHRILCLPLYHDLSTSEVEMISRLILRVLNN
jgi:dTDP-4-amino-4,6-dideoxygalactose transaminase